MLTVKKLSINTTEKTTKELNEINKIKEQEYIKKQTKNYVPVKNELKYDPKINPSETSAKFDTQLISYNDQGSCYWYLNKYPGFPIEYYNIFAHFTNGTLKNYIHDKKKSDKKMAKQIAKKNAKKKGVRLKKKDIRGIKIHRMPYTVTWT